MAELRSKNPARVREYKNTEAAPSFPKIQVISGASLPFSRARKQFRRGCRADRRHWTVPGGNNPGAAQTGVCCDA
jgi:hypothetical protein